MVSPAQDAGRAALLLAAVDTVREAVVGRDMVELGRRLVVPGAPGFPAVDGDDGSLVGGIEQDIGIVRIDPNVLVVVAAGSAAKSGVCLPSIRRFPGDGRSDEQNIRILGMDGKARQVPAADPAGGAGIGRRPSPGFAGIVGPENPLSPGQGDDGIKAFRVGRGDRQVDLENRLGSGRLELPPGLAAVARLEQSAAGTAPSRVFPGALARLPEAGVDNVRIGRIDHDFRSAGILILAQDFFKGLPSIRRAVDPALGVRAVRMTQDGGKDPVRVPRVDGELRDLLALAQSEMGPGPAGVDGFIDAVADREVGSLKAFAAPDIDDVGIRGARRQSPRSNRSADRRISEPRPVHSPSISRRRRYRRRCKTRSAGKGPRRSPGSSRREKDRSTASARRRISPARPSSRFGRRKERLENPREETGQTRKKGNHAS